MSVNGHRSDSDRLAMQLALDHARLTIFARRATMLLAFIPLDYGVLTWVFGERLWQSNEVYATALALPGAPQSWGLLFIVMGAGTLVSAHLERDRCIIGFTLATAIVLAMFMATFVTQVAHGAIGAFPPIVIYAVLSLLFLARACMAWARVRTKRRHG